MLSAWLRYLRCASRLQLPEHPLNASSGLASKFSLPEMVCALGGDGWGTASGRKRQCGLVVLPLRTCPLVTKPKSVLKEKSAFTCKLVGGPHKPFLESPELHLSENHLLCRAPTPPPPSNRRPWDPGAVPRGAGCCPERWLWHRPDANCSAFPGTALIPAPLAASPAWALPPAPAGWFLLKCPL